MATVLNRPSLRSIFSLLALLLLATFSLSSLSDAVRVGAGDLFSGTCDLIECPIYEVYRQNSEYEIRRYNESEWMSTSSIVEVSLVEATRKGFLQLFDYIQGKNKYGEKIEMTAPVITQVSPSDGPFCASSFVISFYIPKKNQGNPPPAKDLHVQKWGLKYVAVRQFGGFVSDDNVGKEAAALYASLANSTWAAAVDKSRAADPTSVYTVAQYNSPFEYTGRVNEIWMTLDLDVSTI